MGGCGATHFLHPHCGSGAAAAGGVVAVGFGGDVIVDQDGFHVVAFVCGYAGCHAEVHDVAGVVFNNVHHASTLIGGAGGTFNLAGVGGGEDVAGAHRVQHAVADETGVEGFVATTSARDQTHFGAFTGGLSYIFGQLEEATVVPLHVRASERDSS